MTGHPIMSPLILATIELTKPMKRSFNTIGWLYLCRRCGNIDKNPHFGVPASNVHPAISLLTDTILGIKTNKEAPDMLKIHACGEDRYGIADLVGFSPDYLS